MTQVCSLPTSTADVTPCHSKPLPKGIHIIEADAPSAPRVGEPTSREDTLPWGYIFIHHMSVSLFESRMKSLSLQGDYRPQYFIHRSLRYRQKPSGHGVKKETVPTVSGLVFLQGTTTQLRQFLRSNFPQYYLVNNCATSQPASIPDRVMQPFMSVMRQAPERITFLRDPFVKFAKDHVRLRVLTGLFSGQEGYVVRIHRDRQLVMNLGGYAVAISGVHIEDFQVVEE